MPLRRSMLPPLVDMRGVDRHTRTHRRGHGHRLEVPPLRRRWLRLDDAVDHRVRVRDEVLRRGTTSLPTGACTMPVLSTRNSTLPALISLIACATFGVTVPVFGFGMRPRGPSTFPETPHSPHHVGRRDDRVEVDPPAENLLDQLVAADVVRPGLRRLLLLVGAGNGEHPLGLAEAVRQDRPCPGPSGRRALGRRPAASSAPPSRRTSRTSPSGSGESPPRVKYRPILDLRFAAAVNFLPCPAICLLVVPRGPRRGPPTSESQLPTVPVRRESGSLGARHRR